MPTLNNHHSQASTKLLLIGESGAGKTGALLSLVEAGYNLRVLDHDNGLDVLVGLVKKKYPSVEKQQQLLSKIAYETHTDKLKNIAGKIVPVGVPQAFLKSMQCLDNWPDLGPVSSWGSDDILVIDSLTLLSQHIFNHVLFLNARIGQDKRIQDWGQAMDITENLLGLLYSTEIKCNVIITSHITYIERDDGVNKGYPSALGNKLPPKVGRYFNSLLLVKSRGTGLSTTRVIRTTPDGAIDLKTPVPGVLPDELPIATGLADFFRAVRGGQGPTTTPAGSVVK